MLNFNSTIIVTNYYSLARFYFMIAENWNKYYTAYYQTCHAKSILIFNLFFSIGEFFIDGDDFLLFSHCQCIYQHIWLSKSSCSRSSCGFRWAPFKLLCTVRILIFTDFSKCNWPQAVYLGHSLDNCNISSAQPPNFLSLDHDLGLKSCLMTEQIMILRVLFRF